MPRIIKLNEKHLRRIVENILQEVRYIKPRDYNETPITDNEVIRVFHGFDNIQDALTTAMYGLSGKMRRNRKFSYENGMNSNGLFVTVKFDVAKGFAFGEYPVVMEFSTKVSDLDFPVWSDQETFYGQNSNPRPFKNRDEREQQKQAYDDTAAWSQHQFIRHSDRPALAKSLVDSYEHQALYVGDLNPEMIKRFWVEENHRWNPLSRKEFLKKYYHLEQYNAIDMQKNRFPDSKLYKPNENFDGWEDMARRDVDIWVGKHPKSTMDMERAREIISFKCRGERPDYQYIEMTMWPKQIIQAYGVDFYREHFNPLSTI